MRWCEAATDFVLKRAVRAQLGNDLLVKFFELLRIFTGQDAS
jgi:hypothetical protein